jgi:nucleoside phosphorylase
MDVSLYTVGIICPLYLELRPVLASFDEHIGRSSDAHHPITYYLGKIGSRYVVAFCLPWRQIGPVNASVYAGVLDSIFPSLELRILVGIAGGIYDEGNDVRLGDVVVGSSVVKYDSGKVVQDGEFVRTSHPYEAPQILSKALNDLHLQHKAPGSLLQMHIARMMDIWPGDDMRNCWTYPGADQDILFETNYDHPSGNSDCRDCDLARVSRRDPRSSPLPVMHVGLIASADQVMRDGRSRQKLKADLKEILAVEMEAAGLRHKDYIVIRGICDYADTHKHKRWQEYAAATAAACTKALLNCLPSGVKYPETPEFSPSLLPTKTRRHTETGSHDDRARKTSVAETQASSSGQTESSHSAIETLDSHNDDASHHSLDQLFPTRSLHGLRAGVDPPQAEPAEAQNPEEDLSNVGNRLTSATSITTVGLPVPSSAHHPSADDNQLFACALLSVTVSLLEKDGTWTSVDDFQSPVRVELIEPRAKHYFKITRILALYDNEPERLRFSLWLPFDRIRTRLQDRTLDILFANCNGPLSRSVNGRRQYFSVYDSANPNVRVHLTLPDSSLAQQLADSLLWADCEIPYHRLLNSFQVWEGCEVKLYECFEDLQTTRKVEDQLAMMITTASKHNQSGMFYLGPRLDCELDTSQNHFKLVLHLLDNVQYKTPTTSKPFWSSRQAEDNREGSPEGSPEAIDFEESAPSTIKFSDQIILKAFLSAIVPNWQLEFIGSVPKLRSSSKRRFLGRRSSSSAQVMVWSKMPECRILARLPDGQKDDMKWAISSLRAPEPSRHPLTPSLEFDKKKSTVILEDVQVLEGTHVLRSDMLAGPQSERSDFQRLLQEFQFEDLNTAEEFARVLEPYVKSAQSGMRASMSGDGAATELGPRPSRDQPSSETERSVTL